MKGLFAFVGNAKGDLYRMNFLSEENRRTSVLRRSLILKSLFSDFRNVFASGMILFLLCCPILEVQSESSLLVWKLYDRYTGVKLGELKTLKDFDLSSPAVQSLMKKRYGNRVPDSEPVISPVDMFHSSELITVVNH
ncbi:hypothetical protein LEP1GSC005_2959 [Leptospira santarosai str. ST188]|nr:hypothetical protein LEP1GSC005_2959 [Leptospira santarosai str. ST188]